MSQYPVKKQKHNMFLQITFLFSVIYIFFWENRYVVNTRLLLMIIAGCAVLAIFSSANLKIQKSSLVFLVALLYTFIGVFYTKGNVDDSIKWIQSLAIMFLAILAFSGCSSNVRTTLIVFAFCSFIFLAGIYIQLIFPDIASKINALLLKSGSLQSNIELYSFGYYCGFSGFNFISALFCVLLMCISLSVAYSIPKKGLKKTFWFTVAFLAFAATIIAQKRGVFVAALSAVIAYILVISKNKKVVSRILQVALLVILFSVIIYVFLLNSESGQLFLERFSASNGDISSGRIDIFDVLLQNVWDYIIFGNGAGSVFALMSAGAHNIYLQFLYEGGIIGLALNSVFLAMNLLYVYKLYVSYEWIAEKKVLLLTSFLFQIVFLVYGLFGNPVSDIFIFLIYVILSSIPYSPSFSIEQAVTEVK